MAKILNNIILDIMLLIYVLAAKDCFCFEEIIFNPKGKFVNSARVDLYKTDNEVRFIISNRITKSIDRKNISYIKVYALRIENGIIEPMLDAFGELFHFDAWLPVSISGLDTMVLAADVTGENPLDRPDNPIPRIWMFKLKYTNNMSNSEDLSLKDQKLKFALFHKGQLGSEHKPDAIEKGVDPGCVLTSVSQIAFCTNNSNGILLGLSRKSAWNPATNLKEFDILWSYEFNLNPPQWSTKGDHRIGSFAQIAAGLSREGMFIASLDNQGTPKVLYKKKAEKLDKAQPEEVFLTPEQKEMQCLCIKSVADLISGFILLQKKDNEHRIVLFRYSEEHKYWTSIWSIPIQATSAVSAIKLDNKICYAYLHFNNKQTELRYGEANVPD